MKVNSQSQFTSVLSLAIIFIFACFLGFTLGFGFNLAFYLLVALAGLILSIANPLAGITATIVLTIVFAKQFTLQGLIIGNDPIKFYLPDILLIGSYIGLGARLIKGEISAKWRWQETLLTIFIGITFAYFLLSIIFLNASFALAFSSFKNYAFYSLIYFFVYLGFHDKAKIKTLAYFVFGACLVSTYFIAYGLFAGKGLWTDITPLTTSGNRLLDFDHAFYFGLANLCGLAYLIFGKNSSWRKAWIWILPIFLFGIIGSLMRHLWLASLAALGLILILPATRERPIYKTIFANYLVAGTSIIMMIILLANVFPDWPVSQKLSKIQDQTVERVTSIANKEDTSFAWRSSVWTSAWWEYRNNVLWGIGFGQRIFVEMPGYLDYVEVRNVHNSFLAIAVQMGLIPFAVLLTFLGMLFAGAVKRLANWPLVNTALAAMMIFCFSAFLFQPYLEANFFNIVFWSILGISRRVYEGIDG